MAENKTKHFQTSAIIILVIIIFTGGIIALSRFNPGEPIIISSPQEEKWQGEISISGGVSNPGIYPYRYNDTLEDLIRSAGGLSEAAEPPKIEFHISDSDQTDSQKIDINRADDWLLEALPGIGRTLAGRIIDYRRQNGPFKNNRELLNVTGIGEAVLEQIEQLITVSD